MKTGGVGGRGRESNRIPRRPNNDDRLPSGCGGNEVTSILFSEEWSNEPPFRACSIDKFRYVGAPCICHGVPSFGVLVNLCLRGVAMFGVVVRTVTKGSPTVRPAATSYEATFKVNNSLAVLAENETPLGVDSSSSRRGTFIAAECENIFGRYTSRK